MRGHLYVEKMRPFIDNGRICIEKVIHMYIEHAAQ